MPATSFPARSRPTPSRTWLDADYDTVIILGPSHYALFDGASVPAVDAYRTPLGLVPISPKARALAKISPCLSEPCCPMKRPDWWPQSSKPAPDPGKDTPDTWEHSVEVEVPFLQKVLTNFSILPVVFGNVDPAQVAQAVATQLDDKTLIVVSSDLSHYHPYDEAKELDTRCVKAMCNLDIEAMENSGGLRQTAHSGAAAPGTPEWMAGAVAGLSQQRRYLGRQEPRCCWLQRHRFLRARAGKLRGTGKKVIAGPGPPDPDLCGDQSGLVGI